MSDETPEKDLVVEEEVEAVVEALSDPLDHDENGKKGGSKKGAASTRAKGSAKKAAVGMPDRTWIILEESDDIPPTGLPISHNCNPYIIKPGEPVEVPNFLLGILDDAILSMPVREPGTQRVIGHRNRMRFPYRKVAAPHDAG